MIAIIGGSGFLGNKMQDHLKKLEKKFTIYDLIDEDESNNGTVNVDIEKLSDLDAIKNTNAIVNLAAVHRDDIRPLSRYDDVNVQGSVNVCEAARKHGINKIIFTSSVAIYGFAPADTDESGEPNYFNDYGRTKYLSGTGL